MVKVRNRSLFILLMVVACITPPAMAHQASWRWPAQAPPDAPETAPDEVVEEATPAPEDPEPTDAPEPEAVPDVPIPTGEAPQALQRTFNLPEDGLPEGTTLTIEGSSSMEVITRTLKQRFEERYGDATIEVVEQSIDEALQSLANGEIEIAAIGRSLTDEEKAQGLSEVLVSREKIAVIVGSDNLFQGDVDSENFVRIFRGEVTNWSQLGGSDLPIRFIDRPASSDTRQALGEYDLFGGDLTTGAGTITLTTDSTAELVEALGNDGISYAIASQVLDQDNVRVLSMHSTFPDDPRYPYSQPRNYVYRGTEPLSPEAEAFLAFATGQEGQVAVANAKAAEAADVAVADLPDRVVAMRPNDEGFVTGDRAGNLNFWSRDGISAGPPVAAHTGPVTALAFSPTEGQRLVSGGADGTIRFWDAAGNPNGEPINAGNGPVTSLVVQPDFNFISANSDGTLQRWDINGQPVGEPMTGHTDTVRDMALTPDGQTLITAAADGTIRRWNVADGSPQGEPLTGHQGTVQALAIKPDGSFASGGTDATVRQWAPTGEAIGDPTEVAGPVTALAVNPDGTRLVAGDETGSLQPLNADGTPTEDAAVTGIDAPIDDIAFTPDGDRLVVSAGETPQIRDPSGQVIPLADLDAEVPVAETAAGTEAESDTSLQFPDLWRRFQQLPLSMQLLLLPIVGLGFVLWWLLRGLQQDEGDDEVDKVEDPAPPKQAEKVPPVDFGADDGVIGNGLPNKDRSDDGVIDNGLPSAGPVSGITPEEASASLDASLSKSRDALTDGIELSKLGRHQAALEAFNRAIESADLEQIKAAAAGTTLAGAGTLIAQGLSRRGIALMNLDRPDEAMKSFDQALEMEPDDLVAWLGKGNVMTKANRFDEAIFCFDKAIELNANTAAAWYGKGMALQKMGRDAEAQSCFARAQALGGGEDISLELEISGTHFGKTPPRPNTAFESDDFGDTGFGDDDFGDTDFGDADFSDTDFGDTPSFETPAPTSPIGDETPAADAPIDTTRWPSAAVSSPPNLDLEDTDVPPDLLEAIADLPDSPDVPEPNVSASAPMDVPPEVDDILSGTSSLPSAVDAADVGAADDDAFAAAPAQEPFSPPETAAIPDQPKEADTPYDPALDGLPAEVLEALRGIPADSPDSFNIPSNSTQKKPLPPPPPSNPRLRRS
ncbi:MAG: substrate-binding domain-containing protein [Leptolyngbyaceae cyanobacterium]